MFWTTDRDGHTVRKYRPNGELLLSLGDVRQMGRRSRRTSTDPPQWSCRTTATSSSRTATGIRAWYGFLRTASSSSRSAAWGSGPAEFNTPHALAQDSQGRLLVADLCGGNFHDYMTVPGQIAAHRTQRTPGCRPRIQRFDPDGNYIDEWTHVSPLSIAVYGKRIYASDKMSNLAILDEDTGEVLQRVDDIAIYIHQLAMDAHGDLYTASVYPEHAGEKRGVAGPSHRRWTRDACAEPIRSTVQNRRQS